MSNNAIEQKLRNLQFNIAQGRTQDELAQSGIYLPQPPPPPPPPTSTSPSSQQQNAFSNYIDSVHRALDSSKQQPKVDYYESPYHNNYIQYDYKNSPSFQINFDNQQQPNFLNNNTPPLTLTNVLRPPVVPPRQSPLIFFQFE